MLGKKLSAMAKGYGLKVRHGIAYGYAQGCFVTISRYIGVVRTSVYIGGPDPVDSRGQTVPLSSGRMEQITALLQASIDAGNPCGLRTGGAYCPAVSPNHNGRVMTVNLRDAAGTVRFFEELLPQIAPLTVQQECFCCRAFMQDAAIWLRVARDTVVPVHPQCASGLANKKAAASPAHRAGRIAFAALMLVLAVAMWFIGFDHWPLMLVIGLIFGTRLPDVLWGTSGYRKHGWAFLAGLATMLVGFSAALLLPIHAEYGTIGSVAQGMMRESAFLRVRLAELFRDGAFLKDFCLSVGLGMLGLVGGLTLDRFLACSPADPACPPVLMD